jgi:hypothetical protein
MSIKNRLQRIEHQAAPALERARKRRQTLTHFFINTKVDFDDAFKFAQYMGNIRTREQTKSDIGEHFLLALAQCNRMYKGIRQLTPEQIHEAQALATVILTREWYGREITTDEAEREAGIIEQARADFDAGIPPEESEAARYFRNLFAEYPRLKNQSDAKAAYLAGADMQEWHKQHGKGFER